MTWKIALGLAAALAVSSCGQNESTEDTSVPWTGKQIAAQAPDEIGLRAADAKQMQIIIEEDAQAQQQFMHPNYIINGPANKVMRKAQVVKMLAEGQIASDSFQRTVEATALTGNVGVVMGDEIVTPAPDSQLGKLFGGKRLQRRFTNVFLWENGKWRFLARQATVVTP